LTASAALHHGASSSPSFLPDGRHFVYQYCSPDCGIYLRSLDGKAEQDQKLVTASARSFGARDTATAYAATADAGLGYVLFERDGALMALPFDARRMEPAGAAVMVAPGIGTAHRSYSASATGVLAFLSGSFTGADTRLLWFDRAGKEVGQVGPPAPWANVQLSPDGKLLVADRSGNTGYDHLWVGNPARGVFSRLNPGDITDYAAAIAPDGRVAFTYTPGSVAGDIYVKPASGVGAPEPLVKSATMKHPNYWSLDGRYLIYDDHTAQKQDLWIVPMAGDRKPIPFLVTPADETSAEFSPDTRWIVYSSDESGTREVYVQGFVPDHIPAAGIGKWRISTDGGDKPRWRRDGKEIYYIANDGKMMAVPVKSTATTFEPGVAVALFETHAKGWLPFDVAPDGRFLINTVATEGANSPPITVVVNWWRGLKQ